MISRYRAAALWLLRLLLVVFSVSVLYRQLFLDHQLNLLWQSFWKQLSVSNVFYLLVTLALIPFNWLAEAFKWCLLSRNSDWRTALKMVIGGSASGFVTPGRSGEFIGRAVLLNGKNSIKEVVYLSVLGGIAQLAVTLFFGAAASLRLGYSAAIPAVSFLAAMGLTVLYYLPHRSKKQAMKLFPFSGKTMNGLSEPEPNIMHGVYLLSALRYLIYLMQYAGLYLFFGLSDLPAEPVVYASVLLLLYSIAPMVPFLDPGIRGGLALWVFSGSGANELAVLSATLSVWIINSALPALIGLLLIWKIPVNEFAGTVKQR